MQSIKFILRLVICCLCLTSLPALAEGYPFKIESWITLPSKKVTDESIVQPSEYCKAFAALNSETKFRCTVVSFWKNGTFKVVALDDPSDDVDISPRQAECIQQSPEEAQMVLEVKSANDEYFANPSSGDVKAKTDAQFAKIAQANINRLLPQMSVDKCAPIRRASAQLLKYTDLCEREFSATSHYLLDKDYLVRNGIGQCIMRAVRSASSEELRSTVDIAFRLTKNPSHTDRNKSLGIIFNAIQADPSLAPYVKAHYAQWLTYISKNSVMPNVGGLAEEILQVISR
jgi:hypothetical protein